MPRITLYRFKTDSDNGYLIELNGEVIEFAPTNDPFEFFEQSDFYVESGKPYYTRKYHSYLCVAQIGNVDHYLDSNGNVLQTSSTISFANDSYSSTANVTIPVPIMMQGSSNCVDNATATLLYYWDRNYSNLVYNFYSTRDDIKSRRVNQQGNDYLTSVVKEYALSRGYFIQPSSKWNPTWSDYSSKINSGRPVLLGFASGYSAPHMTVGCGTFNFSGINYAVVVDGHNSTRVNKKWSSANDFILDAGFTP